MGIVVSKKAIEEASKELSNWGRWGKNDQIGTLNHVTSEDIVKAASLIRTRQGVRARHPARPHGPADRPVRRPRVAGTGIAAAGLEQVRYADDILTFGSGEGTRSATSSTRIRPITATTPS